MTPDPRLMLPATRELLDGWCGPVVMYGDDPGVCLGLVDEDGDARVADYSDALWRSMNGITLDLSRAECRDRVARKFIGTNGPVAYVLARHASGPCFIFVTVVVDNGNPSTVTHACGVETCPALADLDPDDDTRIPDGSRLVDALGLAVVARSFPGGAR